MTYDQQHIYAIFENTYCMIHSVHVCIVHASCDTALWHDRTCSWIRRICSLVHRRVACFGMFRFIFGMLRSKHCLAHQHYWQMHVCIASSWNPCTREAMVIHMIFVRAWWHRCASLPRQIDIFFCTFSDVSRIWHTFLVTLLLQGHEIFKSIKNRRAAFWQQL